MIGNLFDMKSLIYNALEKSEIMKSAAGFFKQDPKVIMDAIKKSYDVFNEHIKSVPNWDVQIGTLMGEAEACGLEPQAAIITAMKQLDYNNLEIATYLKRKFPLQNKEITAIKVKEIYSKSKPIWEEAHSLDEEDKKSSESNEDQMEISAPSGLNDGTE